MGIYPRFTARGRAAWLLAAVLAGSAGIGVALWRGDRLAVALIALALALLVGIWVWGRGGEQG